MWAKEGQEERRVSIAGSKASGKRMKDTESDQQG